MSGSYLIQRLAGALATILIVCVLVFCIMQALPGDPARILAGVEASPEEVERVRVELKLDRSPIEQFATFLTNAAVGDLGTSIRSSQPVAEEIGARLPATLQLAVLAVGLAAIVGVTFGLLASIRPNSIADYSLSAFTIGASSMPAFWLGLLLIIVFAVEFRLLPAGGKDSWQSWILPTATLAAFSVALIARVTRAAMLEVLNQDYIRTARAKGATERRVFVRHGLRNAILPVITVIGIQFGQLIGGAVLTEVVFSWPGIGRLLVESIFARDYPVIQGVILIYAVMIVLLNLLIDLSYSMLDPRIRY
ncbi:MAG: ABC transporter permease [Hyphomicrobiaceae bacterium]|nr:ABC transporter permease [Hyphomicrobiaceae bacterium]